MKRKLGRKIISLALVFMFVCIPININAQGADQAGQVSWEKKISDTLYDEFDRLAKQRTDLSTEKIPVWIWYNDVNHEQIERIVKEKIKLATDNISMEFEMPSISLLDNLKNDVQGSEQEMEDYLARTEKARTLEEKRTEEFVMTRREVSREKYGEKSEGLIRENELNKENIHFISQYAPVIIVEMTKKEIEENAQKKNVTNISLFQEGKIIEESEASVLESSEVIKVRNKLGLTGKNVKVGLIDNTAPGPDSRLDPNKIFNINSISTGAAGAHSTAMAASIGGTNGVAPEVNIYCTNWNFQHIEDLLTYGVGSISMSLGKDRSTPYTDEEKWFDHISANHNVIFIKSAGNTGGPINVPGMAYNVVTVGAYDDKDNGVKSDDSLFGYSAFENTAGCEKPDIVAPATMNGGGTSSATAHTNGIVALMLQLKPSLAYQPQVIKAILLASCQRKVISSPAERMTLGLTEKQGAGVVDAWNAICIVSQNQYGYGEFSGTEERRNFVQPAYGSSNMNVSIAWLQNNTLPAGNHAGGSVTVGTINDIDLRVYQNGTQVGNSLEANSSTEMAYFPTFTVASDKYQIRTSKYNANSDLVRYGYAWSTDKTTYWENAENAIEPDGLFYIRNKTSGLYLTANESTGAVTQSAFTGNRNQQWIADNLENLTATPIKTNSLVYPGWLNKLNNKAVINNSGRLRLELIDNPLNNTYSIKDYLTLNSLYLENPLLANSNAIWTNLGSPARYQWYFEKINMQKGDVNGDGSISIEDATLVQRYILDKETFNDQQMFLADVNNDDKVNIKDATLIQKMVLEMG